jgi:hypothetical protein
VRAPDDLYRMALEYLEDAAAHNVRHSEFSWNPTGTVHVSRIPYAQAQDAIVRAIRDARERFGIDGRLIAAIDREASPEAAVEMVEWMLATAATRWPASASTTARTTGRRNCSRRPTRWRGRRPAHHRARRRIRHALDQRAHRARPAAGGPHRPRLHGGGRAGVRGGMRGPRRAVHGGAHQLLLPAHLPPERWALDHPIRRMPGLGLRIHPNTDDPTLHHVDPTRAWEMMVRDFGFSIDDLRGFMLNGLAGAWIDEDQRRRWQRSGREFDALRARLLPDSPSTGT